MRTKYQDDYRCREEWEERKARHQVLKIWGIYDQHKQAGQFLSCWRESFWRHPIRSLLDLPLVIESIVRYVIFTDVMSHIDDDFS